MRTCTRCGVAFSGASEWCGDCMEVEGVEVHWPILTDYKPALLEAQWALIFPFYQAGKYDHEIADELGVTMEMVRRVRREMGKPANKRDDRYLWHDKVAQQQHAAQMVKHRKKAKRGAKASYL